MESLVNSKIAGVLRVYDSECIGAGILMRDIGERAGDNSVAPAKEVCYFTFFFVRGLGSISSSSSSSGSGSLL